MIWEKGPLDLLTTPPHDITGKEVAHYLPKGNGAAMVKEIMDRSKELLTAHPLNRERKEAGKRPGNGIWLWGQGKRAALPSFGEKFGLKGATVCAVDLIKGISSMVGFTTPHIEGATGYLDTDYGAKARAAFKLLSDHDIVYIHVEAPDEASHNGNVPEKIKAIERIDKEVLGFLLKETGNNVRFLIVTDHATPVSLKTHYATPVPFAVYEKGASTPATGDDTDYDEEVSSTVISGEEMIRVLIKGQKP